MIARRRRIASLRLLAPLLLAAVASSCGGGDSPPDGVTTLRIITWSTDTQFDTERMIFDRFEELNPGIKVEIVFSPYDYYIEKLLTLAISGDPPDLMWTGQENVPFLATRGIIRDLTDVVASDPEIDTSNYFATALDLCSYKGRLYGLPRDVCCYFLAYNKEMFRAAGLPMPTPDWTWEEFREIGKKLVRDDDGDGKKECFAYAWYPIDQIYQNGGKIIGEQGDRAYFDSPETVEALKWWADNVLVYGIAPKRDEEDGFGGDLMISRAAAMIPAGPWMISTYAEQCEFEWDIVNMPRGKAGNKARLLGLPIGISTRTKHFEEAYRLLRFLCYDEVAQTMQAEIGIAMPSRRDIALSPAFRGQPIMPPGIESFLNTMVSDTVVENVFPYYPPIKMTYLTLIDTVRIGSVSVAAAAEEAQEDAERVIGRAKIRGLF